MKIGTCVRFDDAGTIGEKLERLAANGFDNCQIVSWNPALWTAENAARITSLCRALGITVSAFWAGWTGPCVWNFYEGQKTLGLVPPRYRKRRVRELCLGSDFAARLGVSDVVTHMGFIPEDPFDRRYSGFCDAVREVALHCRENGQYLLFEAGQETPVTMLRTFETVGTGNLGVNLDTANVILYGKANPVDALDVFGKYVRNLHAKDGFYPTDGTHLGREVPIGTGKVDFRAVFEKLRTLGYDGFVTIEYELSAGENEAILAAKRYLEALCRDDCGGR